MIEKKEMVESQHLLWDRILDERALQAGREARILGAMLKELGGDVKAGWRFDEENRLFFRVVPDAPSDNNSTAPTP